MWEGLFIDVNGHISSKTLTIGNMYRLNQDNNNIKNIEKFIDEIPPSIDIIQNENSYAAIVGDFNINLLQVNEREKICRIFRPDVHQQLFLKNNSSNTHCKTISEFDWSDIL